MYINLRKIFRPFWIDPWKESFLTSTNKYPKGFLADGWAIGIKANKAKDLGIIYSQEPALAAAVFTKNKFIAHPIVIGRAHTQNGKIQAFLVNSGNANVANGPAGARTALESCRQLSLSLKIDRTDILPSSTGIMAEPFPDAPIVQACKTLPQEMKKPNFPAFAEAIMTTDAYPKMLTAELSNGIRIVGIAKGAGMVAPNMATLLAYICTDAKISQNSLQVLIKALVKRSFNCISVDTDSSTNDTFSILANGASQKEMTFF